jgi:hypothetical protein
MPIDPVVLGQILLAAVTGVIVPVVGGILVVMQRRSTAYWTRQLADQNARAEKEKNEAQRALELQRMEMQRQLELLRIEAEQARAEAQAAVIQAQSFATERIVAAEGEVRNIADTHRIMMQMITLMSESGKRADEKDARTQAAMTQLLDASRESTDTLKGLVRGLDSVKTNLGENVQALTLMNQVVAALPTQLVAQTNPLTEAIKDMVRRVDTLIDGLDAAKAQLLADLVAAIHDVLTQTPPLTLTEGNTS